MEIIYQEQDGVGGWIANLNEEGEPVIINVKNLPPEFFEKVGRNTSYLYHYEEILAENFAYLITEYHEDVPNPEILVKLDNVLSQ